MMFFYKKLWCFLFPGIFCISLKAQTVSNVAEGWASNTVNTVVFRKNALTTYRNFQFISFYDGQGHVIVGKRKISSAKWTLLKTRFKGNVADAHCSISIAVDGKGYLHISWGHHNNKLRYAKGLEPLGLDLGEEEPMTGLLEDKVSYPEFYRMSDGSLLFFYRDGGSGNGSLVINKYDLEDKRWTQLHQGLIDGQGKRNAYWQACVDGKGTVHISWTWRESPDVASNHDICYARSTDGGITWERSTGEKYTLPVNAANAEYALKIPQNSELINQTSMTVNGQGDVLIASYWSDAHGVPQYHVVQRTSDGWQVRNLGFRKSAFSLSGGGTKRIPISRPQIISWKNGKSPATGVIFRDEERGGAVSMAVSKEETPHSWQVIDIYKENCGSYEPLYDIDLWNRKRRLHLFVQKTDQVDGEGRSALPPQMVKVVEWKKIR